jgi:hypothetical protein
MFATIANANAILLRPFRQRVDVETVALALVFALFAAGAWHITLSTLRSDMEVPE